MNSNFIDRHIGPSPQDKGEMLKTVNAHNIDQLVDQTIPDAIRLGKELQLMPALDEEDYLAHIRRLALKNKVFSSYIGMGYYNTHVPSVLMRNIFENPGWYTAYTPYQAEISQGRLEALLNFQTMVSDLTALPIANASLLDEATAAAEAMVMFFNSRTKSEIGEECNKFFVSQKCFPQTIQVLQLRAQPLGIDLVVGDVNTSEMVGKGFFGVFFQYPDGEGGFLDWSLKVKNWKEGGLKIAVASDLLSLCLLTPPGEWGADVVVGNSQRFGVPLGFGGPHAAFFATTDEFKRKIPGRIIGVSKDRRGKMALRMALQTREQHIRRDKATSNICTAQALLAIMASMYAVYHGAKGLKNIALNVHIKTKALAAGLGQLGLEVLHGNYFDTLCLALEPSQIQTIEKEALKQSINFRYFQNENKIGISLDQTTNWDNVQAILDVFSVLSGSAVSVNKTHDEFAAFDENLHRKSEYLTHPVFNKYRSETDMMRYLKRLENKDISLTHSMIALGSCTMKLNAASELMPLSQMEFSSIHPFVPINQAEGYTQMISSLEESLKEITGFTGVSLQPNSGAQGEYAGLMVIRAYHNDRGDTGRNIALIPSSAHGTNPASAVLAGMQVVVIKCDEKGNIDVADLKEKAQVYSNTLSCLMVTYPSTHGVYEKSIKEITGIIHQNGGLVYMDGANMNAQVGLTSPGNIGADVCHLNLHKTFAIPHGGGGPGMGPIGVNDKLKPYLPGHFTGVVGGDKKILPVSAAPWGSALILLISYGFVRMMGAKGLTKATKVAILNANYLKDRLKDHYPILYVGEGGRVAHEMILDCRDFKKSCGIEVEDIAKRLIDYGFHAPTVSFPVAGTLMIEPTESESKAELDRFCQAMIQIRKEIREVEEGKYPKEENVLKNAPHTASELADEWLWPYSIQKAVFPLPWVAEAKYWVSVSRVDNAHGDRNLICSCPPMEAYEMELVES